MACITLLFVVTALLGYRLLVVEAKGPNICIKAMHSGFACKTVLRCTNTYMSIVTHFLAACRYSRRCKSFSKQRTVKLYLTVLLLLNSYAPEPNPGPDSINATVSEKSDSEDHCPCGECDLSVTWGQRGVQCETCGHWFHASCQSITDEHYAKLNDSKADISWYCALCGNPNSIIVFNLHVNDWQFYSTDFSGSSTGNSEQELSSSTPTEKNFHPLHTSTPSRASQQDKWKGRPLRILNVNFQSCIAKRAPMQNVIDSLRPDIIFGTETHIDDNISDTEALPGPYLLYRNDRNREGGGVFVAVHKNLNSFAVEELQTDCEIVWAALKLKGNKTLYLCSFYRPDDADQESLRKFGESLDRLSSNPNAHVLIGGDFNFPGFDWETALLKPKTPAVGQHREFLELISDHGLEQMVTQPTRLSNTLDLILTNTPGLIPRVETVMGVSDHEIVYCEFNIAVEKNKQSPRWIKLYNKADWDGMRDAMKALYSNIVEEVGNLTTEEIWTRFKEAYLQAEETYVPRKQARPKCSKPWVTPDIKKLINRRARVYKKMKKTGRQDLREESTELRRKIQRKLRRAYWTYISETITETPSDEPSASLKRFWTYIKHQRTAKVGISPLKVQGRLISEPKQQAKILNEQFQSVFTDGQVYTREQFMDKCSMDEADYSEFSKIHISEGGVRKLLEGLNPNKACGPDGISPRVLKELANEVAPILTLLFKTSMDTGTVPEDWRAANIAPVFKKGEHYNPANYRPVSLTSIPCKIMEHIIVSSLMDHLEKNNILSPRQHGFRRKRSCETQLLEFMEELTENMENCQQTDIVIMDFEKAFDKVNHSLLQHKLHHYGVRGQVNRWIGGFLQDRKQAVVVENARSDYVAVKSGVPQGSVLGPSLFLIYINDLPGTVSSPTRLFADDTATYRTITSCQDQSSLQHDLQQLEKWEKSWDMSFHPGKCTTLPVISPKRMKKLRTPSYQLHNHTLTNVTSAKYLGVTIAQDLDWDLHVHNITTKANKTLGFLRRNLKIGNVRLKEQAYKAMVRPVLEYASSVWDPYKEGQITKLENVQRRSARFVLNRYQKTASVTAMLNHLGWTSLQSRRKTTRLTMMFKIINNMVQVDFGKLHKTQEPKLRATTERDRRAHSKQLSRLQCSRDYRRHSFLPRTIPEWNDTLTEAVVEAGSLGIFMSGARKIHQ